MTIGMWPGGERCHFCWLDDYISFWNKFVDIKEICVIYNLKCIYIILISLKICAIQSILLIYIFENISKIDLPNRGKKLGWWFTKKLSRNHLFTNHEPAMEFPSLRRDCTTADSTYYRTPDKEGLRPFTPNSTVFQWKKPVISQLFFTPNHNHFTYFLHFNHC